MDMASKKEFLDFILEQFNNDEITYRKMMGEFILYYQGKIVGGIYDDRLLLKPNKSLIDFLGEQAKFATPYFGAKPMIFIDNVDDSDFLKELLNSLS